MKLTIEGGNFVETELLTRAIRAQFCVTEELDAKHQSDGQPYTRTLAVDIYKEPNGAERDVDQRLGHLVKGIRQEVEADCEAKAARLAMLAHGWKRAARKYKAKAAALLWVPE